MSETSVELDTDSLSDYKLFLAIKSLPRYSFVGHTASFPSEYASIIGLKVEKQKESQYLPHYRLFDYQAAFSRLAIRKQKFALFIAPGYGKTFCGKEFASHAIDNMPAPMCCLWVSPLMVIKQTIREIKEFYGQDFEIEQVRSAGLQEWLSNGKSRFGITNWESMTNGLQPGRLGCIVGDETSYLKSHYGKWGQNLIELGKGIPWKLCLTGTPAPNDRIEYANHAVFLDQFPTVNSFLARFFVNRGQTSNRWELKQHALRPFYTSLSHWSVFMDNPATYGFKDNAGTIPPINVHIHDVPLTDRQQELVAKAGGDMFGTPGGITSRSKLSQLAKGKFGAEYVPTEKYNFIRDLIATWPDESTLIWAMYNHEQEQLEKTFPEAGSIAGSTKEAKRERIIEDFQSGKIRQIISKAKCLGLGLNLQKATRQVFSSAVDSYESWIQCLKRSNRVGSTMPLNAHLPITPIERKMIETILVKAARVQADTEEQEQTFKECNLNGF